jgi:N-methylhydantoinase A
MRFVGIDTGGTFTDVLLFDGATGTLRVKKHLSTPHDPSEAFLEGVADIAASGWRVAEIDRVSHATTVATNTVIERSGARAGLITTRGFRDVLAIGRGARPTTAVYDLGWARPEPLVPRYLRLGVTERVDASGRILTPLDEGELLSAARFLVGHGIESIAVCFLFSYLNPANELRAKALLAGEFPKLPVSASCEILPQWREYERTNTTAADAFVRPVMGRYIGRLADGLRDMGFAHDVLIMRSNGGVAKARTVAELPIETFLSGPAAAVVAAQHVGRQAGMPDLVSMDMGGTSFDVAILVDGEPRHATEGEIEPTLPVRVAMVDIRTIGAGGGSIAWTDDGGALKVGPQSAKALPGPACYGRGGTEPTTTDANVVLGRIDPDHFLGGTYKLRADLAEAAIDGLAAKLGLDRETTAQGILDVTVANMSQAIRAAAAQRGIDLRAFTLFAGGGAGPLAAPAIARDLSMSTILIPRFPGMLSTIGLLLSDLRFDMVRSLPTVLEQADMQPIGEILGTMAVETRRRVAEEKLDVDIELALSLDMRYRRQNWEIAIAVDLDRLDVATIAEAFDAEHERMFGFRNAGQQHEIINLRCVATGRLRDKESLLARLVPKFGQPPGTPIARRPLFDEKLRRTVATPIFERDELTLGQRIDGPALIIEPDSTVYVPSDGTAEIDPHGNIVIRLDHGSIPPANDRTAG